jgi:hypothetical protein
MVLLSEKTSATARRHGVTSRGAPHHPTSSDTTGTRSKKKNEGDERILWHERHGYNDLKLDNMVFYTF